VTRGVQPVAYLARSNAFWIVSSLDRLFGCLSEKPGRAIVWVLYGWRLTRRPPEKLAAIGFYCLAVAHELLHCTATLVTADAGAHQFSHATDVHCPAEVPKRGAYRVHHSAVRRIPDSALPRTSRSRWCYIEIEQSLHSRALFSNALRNPVAEAVTICRNRYITADFSVAFDFLHGEPQSNDRAAS
jgi:hypothetical protein